MKTPRTSPTEEIHAEWWPSEPTRETVTVKTFLNGWEGVQLRAAFRRLTAADATREGGPDAELLAYEQALAMVEWGVTALTLTWADGTQVKPERADYERLEGQDLNYIASEFGRFLNAWNRTPAEPTATGEEADAAGFQPSAGGGPADSEGNPGPADGGGDAGGTGGGPASTDVPGELGHASVDVSQPA